MKRLSHVLALRGERPPSPSPNSTPRSPRSLSRYGTASYGLQFPEDAPSMSSHYHFANPGSTTQPIETPESQTGCLCALPLGGPSSQATWSTQSSELCSYGDPGGISHVAPPVSAERTQYLALVSGLPVDRPSSQAAWHAHPSEYCSYGHPDAIPYTVQPASTEWNDSLLSGSMMHSFSEYEYTQQDREPGSELYSPKDLRSEETLIPKRRKRVDANQLHVLNATYQKTAYPSGQARESLAKELDMSPDSVRNWFKNKRHMMRQSGIEIPQSRKRHTIATFCPSSILDDTHSESHIRSPLFIEHPNVAPTSDI